MCLICVDYQRAALTTTEAWRNLQEMRETMTDEHYDEVVSMIIEKLYEDQIEAEDEEDLMKLLDELEEDGQLAFAWNEAQELTLDEDDVGEPWSSEFYGDPNER